jgi:hypothetical protein
MAATRKIELFEGFLQRLREALSFDPETGEFRWRVTAGRRKAGALAGHVKSNGYRYVGFEGREYLAHRLAWAYQFGNQPPPEIDHANRGRDRNAIGNLRPATRVGNNGNSGILRSNTSGYRGVSWDRRRARWEAYIWRGNRKAHLGYFDDAKRAARAYNDAARQHFGDFATLNQGA